MSALLSTSSGLFHQVQCFVVPSCLVLKFSNAGSPNFLISGASMFRMRNFTSVVK